MRAALVIAQREVYAFFVSPLAYILLTGWLVLAGLQYWIIAGYFADSEFLEVQNNPLTYFFGRTLVFYLLLLVFVPLVTMRLVAEERSRGTLETLMTAPVHDLSIVAGKYLACLVYWIAFWLPTGLYVYLTSQFGDIDLGAVAASYVGLFLVGAGYLAVGLLMSTLSPNQIISAVLTFTVLCILFILSWLPQLMTEEQYRDVFAFMAVAEQMKSFSRGVVDSRFVVFYASMIGFCFILSVGALNARRTEG